MLTFYTYLLREVLIFQPLIYVAGRYGHQPGYIARRVNVIHKIKMLCEMTLGLQLYLMCGHFLGLISPKATFPLDLFNPDNDLNSFSRLGTRVLLFRSHLPFSTPHLWWIDCHGRLKASTTLKLSPFCLVSFTSSRDLCDECGQFHNPLRNQSMQSIQAFANLIRKTSGHEAQQDINNPCF